MKFRIKKEDGIYFAEYRWLFSWWFVSGSVSRNIETTRKVCMEFERPKIVERFKVWN